MLGIAQDFGFYLISPYCIPKAHKSGNVSIQKREHISAVNCGVILKRAFIIGTDIIIEEKAQELFPPGRNLEKSQLANTEISKRNIEDPRIDSVKAGESLPVTGCFL